MQYCGYMITLKLFSYSINRFITFKMRMKCVNFKLDFDILEIKVTFVTRKYWIKHNYNSSII